MLVACFAISAGVRYQQFETWKLTPKAYFVGDRPMMTTLDAPYWLRWAREKNEDIYRKSSSLREYPKGTDVYRIMSVIQNFQDTQVDIKLGKQTSIDHTSTLGNHTGPKLSSPSPETPEISYRDVPLLSFLIAHLSPFFNYNYYLTGTLLIPVLASLFILPLGIYFLKTQPNLCSVKKSSINIRKLSARL